MLAAAGSTPATVPTIPVVSSVLRILQSEATPDVVHHGLPRALSTISAPHIVNELDVVGVRAEYILGRIHAPKRHRPTISVTLEAAVTLGHADNGHPTWEQPAAGPSWLWSVRIMRWLAAVEVAGTVAVSLRDDCEKGQRLLAVELLASGRQVEPEYCINGNGNGQGHRTPMESTIW